MEDIYEEAARSIDVPEVTANRVRALIRDGEGRPVRKTGSNTFGVDLSALVSDIRDYLTSRSA